MPISDGFSLWCFPPLFSQPHKLGAQTAAGITLKPQWFQCLFSLHPCPFLRPSDAPSATKSASACSTMALGPGFGIRGWDLSLAGHHIFLRMGTPEPNISRKQDGDFYMYLRFCQIIQQMSLSYRDTDGQAHLLWFRACHKHFAQL